METITLDTPEQRSDRHIEYAGFWRRLVAFVIDVLIIYILQFSIILPLMGVIGFTSVNVFSAGPMETTESTTFFSGAYVLLNLINVGITWIYFALMESGDHQASLGKMALGIIVTDKHGQKLTFVKATGRYFSKLVSHLTLFVGFIMAGFTEKKQALHDIIAGTLVIKK